jgi:hypothetical protein
MKTTNARAVVQDMDDHSMLNDQCLAAVQNMDDHSMLNDLGLAAVKNSNDCTAMDDQNCPGPQLFFPSGQT